MSTASTASKLALKKQSSLMSGDMGIASTAAAGQAQHATMAAQPTSGVAAPMGAYDMHSMHIASNSLPAQPASSSSVGRPAHSLAVIFQQVQGHSRYKKAVMCAFFFRP